MPNKRILIIDDSEALREMVRFCLEDEQFDIEQAVDGEQGLLKIFEAVSQNKPFDLVITDQLMPGAVDGIAVITKMQTEASTRHIPVLMLTNEQTQEMKKKARNAGAAGWLIKPFNPDALLESVREVLP